jgi:branched-subunit amino acid ABC-type transport system permease component
MEVSTMAWLDAQVVPGIDGLGYGLLLFLVASGLTAAFGVGNTLNLAHGTLCAFGAYTTAVLSHGTWGSLCLSVAAGSAAGAAGGAVLAVLVAPLAGRGPLDQALLTVGVALVGGDLLATGTGGSALPVVVPAAVAGTTSLAGHRYPVYRLLVIVVAVAIACAGYLILAHTRAGRVVRATVADADMVACVGINPRRVRAQVLVASGALAGAAGAIGAPIIGAGPGTAESVLLLSVVIVVVGGLGSVPGALAAAIGVGEVQTLGISVLPDWVAPYLLYAAAGMALIGRGRPLRRHRPAPLAALASRRVVDGGRA